MFILLINFLENICLCEIIGLKIENLIDIFSIFMLNCF